MSKTETVKIDRLDPNDFFAVMDEIILWNNYEAEHYDRGLEMDEYDRAILGERMAMIIQDHEFGMVFVAKDGDEVVGFVVGFITGQRGHIQELWVNEDYRGGKKPIYAELFKTIMLYFRYQRCIKVNCSFARHNKSIISLATKHEFRPVSVNYQLDLGIGEEA